MRPHRPRFPEPRSRSRRPRDRRGIILPLAAVLLVVVFAFVAFSVDVGYMTVARTELQAAADGAALAGAAELPDGESTAVAEARAIGGMHSWAGRPLEVAADDVTVGRWDLERREFTAGTAGPNAVRVLARSERRGTFFGSLLGRDSFEQEAEAVAVIQPRDICFVIDTSGSMNDDTEPCWATAQIDAAYDGTHPDLGTGLMRTLYADLGFGDYPGPLQHVGGGLVPEDEYAYVELTKDDGRLSRSDVPARWRILPDDDEPTRKRKCYSALIDLQLPRVMPNARPAMDSRVNYDYWAKYLDYVIHDLQVGEDPPPPPPSSPPPSSPPPSPGPSGPPSSPPPSNPPPSNPPPSSPPPPPPPAVGSFFPPTGPGMNGPRTVATVAGADTAALVRDLLLPLAAGRAAPRGTPRRGSTLRTDYLPIYRDSDRIHLFNNPNPQTFPSAPNDVGDRYRNKLGYQTYTQFMLDWGADRSPQFGNDVNADRALAGKVPLSRLSPDHRTVRETVAGRPFDFPPRTQPMHALRRSLIAGLDEVEALNGGGRPAVRDWVSVVSFDGNAGFLQPTVLFPLSADYAGAMDTVATLQAVADVGATTALEPAIVLAQQHLRPGSEGGSGREFAEKVLVIVTDGVPNAWTSDSETIEAYVDTLPAERSGEFYGTGRPWVNGPLMQTDRWRGKGKLFPVGMGLGTDYGFMDRLARLADTADPAGRAPRSGANPAEYEEQLREIFVDLLRPDPKLVK